MELNLVRSLRFAILLQVILVLATIVLAWFLPSEAYLEALEH